MHSADKVNPPIPKKERILENARVVGELGGGKMLEKL
jgi:hypothetical protein